MKELTALQWAKIGYIPNPKAKGEERWTNCVHVKKAIYYSCLLYTSDAADE